RLVEEIADKADDPQPQVKGKKEFQEDLNQDLLLITRMTPETLGDMISMTVVIFRMQESWTIPRVTMMTMKNTEAAKRRRGRILQKGNVWNTRTRKSRLVANFVALDTRLVPDFPITTLTVIKKR